MAGSLFIYPPEKLNKATIEAPSDTVFKYTGAYGVSEPAVRLYTGAELELVKKNQEMSPYLLCHFSLIVNQ